MAEDWDFYMCRVDGKLASMALDLGLAATAPDAGRPLMGFVRIPLLVARPDGLSDRTEFDRLEEIEEALIASVVPAVDATYVGRCTTEGHRDFYFYFASRSGLDAAVGGVFARFAPYRPEIVVGEEPGWETYLHWLFPGRDDLQSIMNRRVCDNLEKHGDTLTKPREIMHWAYFPSSEAADRFAVAIAEKGFRIEEKIDPAAERHGFGVRFARADVPGRDRIDALTGEILDGIAREGGDYDGWETFVERNEP